MPSRDYWELRRAEEMHGHMEDAEKTAEDLIRYYVQAKKLIDEETKSLFTKYRLKTNLSKKQAMLLLNAVKDPGDLKKIIAAMKRQGIDPAIIASFEDSAYFSRLKRILAISTSLDAVVKSIAGAQEKALEKLLLRIGERAYYEAIMDVQKQVGAFPFSRISPDVIHQIMHKRWSGKNFSKAVWDNTEDLAAEVKRAIMLNLMTGRDWRAASNDINDKFASGQRNARRLIRTESTYVTNQLNIIAYRDMRIKNYIYSAVLDLRTSDTCRDLDRKSFPVKDAKLGVNFPPMHPWCRSTTIAEISPKFLKEMVRSARDPVTGKTMRVPADMTYWEWYDKYVTNNPDAVAKEKAAKKSGDRKQHQRYREILGDLVPENLEDFQDMKYTDVRRYGYVKLDYSRRRRLLNHPETALPSSGGVHIPDRKFTAYFFDPESGDGWPKGEAFTDRLGYTKDNWELFGDEMMRASAIYPAKPTRDEGHGQKYDQDVVLYGRKGKPMSVTITWMVEDETGRTVFITATPGRNDKDYSKRVPR